MERIHVKGTLIEMFKRHNVDLVLVVRKCVCDDILNNYEYEYIEKNKSYVFHYVAKVDDRFEHDHVLDMTHCRDIDMFVDQIVVVVEYIL